MTDHATAAAALGATPWAALVDTRAIEPLDAQLGRFLDRRARLDPDLARHADLLARSIALCSRERGRGHSCVFLDDWAGCRLDDDGDGEALCPAFPDVASWRTALQASHRLVGDGSRPTPLALVDDRLYLHRFLAAETRLGARIRHRAAADVADRASFDAARFRALFPALEPDDHGDAVDWQAIATLAALRGRLAVILGGPGTGKTTTVAKLLALLLEDDPGLRVALAAPTGKAAARLVESIGGQLDRLDLPADIRQLLEGLPATTLHRLLRYRPFDESFGRDARHPLAADLVVVDEASMIDLELMDALFAALPETSRVVLLGDPDQLASVATGHVLGDVMTAADPDQGCSPALAAATTADDRPAPTVRAEPHPLQDAVVRLRRTWRFGGGIAALATAIRDGDPAAARQALTAAEHTDIELTAAFDPRHPAATLDRLDDWLCGVHAAPDPALALEALGAAQVLCALRAGPQGVATLNEAVETRLHQLDLPSAGPASPYYHGRPILVTVNDPDTGLYNGDIGLVWNRPGAAAAVWFPANDGQDAPRSLPPGRLPPHETAWAMTVHKAQGSEYATVLLVLPTNDSPVATRELIYTGATRAKRRLTIAAEPAALDRAVLRRTRRVSGLVGLLNEP